MYIHVHVHMYVVQLHIHKIHKSYIHHFHFHVMYLLVYCTEWYMYNPFQKKPDNSIYISSPYQYVVFLLGVHNSPSPQVGKRGPYGATNSIEHSCSSEQHRASERSIHHLLESDVECPTCHRQSCQDHFLLLLIHASAAAATAASRCRFSFIG